MGVRGSVVSLEVSENRPMMYMSLSYDHRIVAGKEMLEDRESLSLEG
nr:2-oxo acid dehydrogenase subunit E2 [Ectobacillus panaciterrae]